MSTQIKYANIQRHFLNMFIFYGEWDGSKVHHRKCPYYSSNVLLVILFVFVLKFFIFGFVDRHSIWCFFLGDFVNFEDNYVRVVVSVVGTIFIGWAFVGLIVYRRLNWNHHETFWLRFVPFDMLNPPVSTYYMHRFTWKTFKVILKMQLEESNGDAEQVDFIPGITYKQLRNIQFLYHKYSRRMIRLLLLFSSIMTVILNGGFYYSFSKKYMFEHYFWPVFVFTSVHMGIIAFYIYHLLFGVSLNYTFLTYLQQVRLKNGLRRMIALTTKENLSLNALSHQLRLFNMILLDMFRINSFWSKMFGINYYGAMLTIFMFSQQIVNGNAYPIRIGFTIIITTIYFNCLFFPVLNASQVHESVSSDILYDFFFFCSFYQPPLMIELCRFLIIEKWFKRC